MPEHATRDPEGGCDLEVLHAGLAHAHLVGQRVRLRFRNHPAIQAHNWAVTRKVILTDNAQRG